MEGKTFFVVALSVLVGLFNRSDAYPMFSNKLYNRGWTPLPMYVPRTGIPAPYAPYYDPFGQDFGEVMDFYYPVDPYEKFRMYQPPYYYSDLAPYNYYGLDDAGSSDSDDEIQDSKSPDIPYGQETWYENGPKKQSDSNAETNAIFLQNLILAQMYRDAASKGYRYPVTYSYTPMRDDYDDGSYIYGEPISDPMPEQVVTTKPKEDEDVKDLKSLVGDKPRKHRRNNIFAEQRKVESKKVEQEPIRRRSWYENNQWSPEVSKRQTETTAAPAATQISRIDKGQDEFVIPRPAPSALQTKTYHTYSTRGHYQPSVYDSIKKLLHMQDKLEEQEKIAESSQSKKKRSYTTSEESLVQQLGNLKKTA